MATESAKRGRAALPRALSDFLIEFAVATHRFGMYPGGHPSLKKSVEGLVARLPIVLHDRAVLSIGVARRQLIIEGVATDSGHPLLRGLAERLHNRHIGAMTIAAGLDADESTLLLQELARERVDSHEALPEFAHVRLYPLSFGNLELVGEEDGDDDTTRASELWLGLARAALTPEHAQTDAVRDPTAVARALEQEGGARAYDQVVVGHMLQLAEELKRGGEAGGTSATRRLSRLFETIDRKTLESLLEMGGDVAQRERFLHDAASVLSPDAVLELARAAGAASGQSISDSMLRMLSKLSAFAEAGEHALHDSADDELRNVVKDLVHDWTLEDPNPSAYTRALASLATKPRRELFAVSDRHPPEPLRLVQMAVETDALGKAFVRAVATLLEEGQAGDLVKVASEARADARTVRYIWQRMVSPETVTNLVMREPIDFDALNAVLDRMDTSSGISILLDRLAESPTRATRMGIYKRLTRLGYAVVPAVIERLSDPRWYVVRNSLALLKEIGTLPLGYKLDPFLKHSEPRVRREAIQLALRVDGRREEALRAGLQDTDERTFRLAALALQSDVPRSVVPHIVARLQAENLPPDVRLALVRSLGSATMLPQALDALLNVAIAGRALLGGIRLAAPSPEVVEAIAVLARSRSTDERVRQVLERARKSDDARIRAAVGAA